MEKYVDEKLFYDTLNQWVRDGSNITNVTTNFLGVYIELLGADGCKEEMFLSFEDDNND